MKEQSKIEEKMDEIEMVIADLPKDQKLVMLIAGSTRDSQAAS